MPVSFRFIRNTDNQEMKLAKIDDEVCERLGVQPETDYNHPRYDTIVNVGISVLYNQGGGEVTKEKFDAWIAQQDAEFIRRAEPDLRHFLFESYTFHGWR